ncbi:MAG: hypothetical protein U0V02_12930 [Anaerolineales bacterium]
MKAIGKIIIASVLLVTLTSCSTFVPQPTETPTSTATSLPTPTNTSEPTNTPVPSTETPSAPVLPMPSGKPLNEWEGIPVMPDAIAGEGDSTGYSFTINALPEDIQTYYEKELAKLGWNIFASGQGETNAILLIFMKGTATLTVSIIPQSDGIIYVMLVK